MSDEVEVTRQLRRANERAALRDYQRRSVEQVCLAAKRGERRVVVCQPVGSGKTEVMAELCRIARFPLMVVPLVDLMRQGRDRLEMRLGERCDIEQGGNYAESIEGIRRRVIVGSRDSLLSCGRYKAKAYERVTLVLVDECHVGMTPRMEEMLKWFEDRGATIVGFSATPYKGKGKALRYWPRPQVVYSLMDAINDGWLVSPKCFLSESKSFDLTLVEEEAGEWNKAQLHAVLTAEHFAQEVTSLVLSTYDQKPSVVYACNRRQAELFVQVFERYGARVSLVHCRQNPEVRKANMDAFLAGDTKIIVNVGILGYGWDHPELRNVYMAAPTRSLSRYEQRLGRGTRVLPGILHPEMTRDERLAAIAASSKPHFNIYDITDSSRSHQLLNALQVLDAKCRKKAARTSRITSMLSMDGVDAVAAIKEADAIDLAELEAQAQELIEKRKRLVVGVTFDHDTRDLFSEPEGKKKRGWRMMYGKYKGVRLDSIPEGYLSWVLESQRKETPFKTAVRKELDRRKEKPASR
jgi:superfamily II DNA or RNA helicase